MKRYILPDQKQGDVKPKFATFGENVLWAYSCLQMMGCMKERG